MEESCTVGQRKESETKVDTKAKLEDEVDALFKFPLAEFTTARNTRAARLKNGGRWDEADRMKALVKPSISAWTVNQFYWKHRDAFDRLIESGVRFQQSPVIRFCRKAR